MVMAGLSCCSTMSEISDTILFRESLRLLVVEALINAQTLAGPRVFSPRDTTTYSGSYPAILVQARSERKQGWRKGGLSFTTTASILVNARVEHIDPAVVETQLETFQFQIERAIITYYPLYTVIQQFASIDTDVQVASDGKKHIGEIAMVFGLEYAEIFDPITDAPASQQPIASELEIIDITINE